MVVRGRAVLILGGSGLVGLAVARRVLRHDPRAVIISALKREEAEEAIGTLESEGSVPSGTVLVAEWGDLFAPEGMKDRPRAEILADPKLRSMLLDDLYDILDDGVVRRSTLGSILLRHQPDIIVDCVNTATAFAYQNVFESTARMREEARAGEVSAESVEGHLATSYLPQLIRHVQIALDAMRRVGTKIYLKIGTAGTGGMGLNIPFTHAEERPSRMLLAKSSIAGAHTLLLFLMARTPGGPAVKEIKPAAAISWKRIAYGEVRRRGRPIERVDSTRPIAVEDAFRTDAAAAFTPLGETLHGVFLDAGENGLFSRGEFETLTSLGLMEFITPEEIAENVEREILGHPTGRDMVAALDGAVSGPTYRAGVLREAALERMGELEREYGIASIAYEMLGPPRLSKLLFEAAILARLYPDVTSAAKLDPEDAALGARTLITEDDELRIRILSIGLPILLPDGERMLRGAKVHVAPGAGQSLDDPRLPDNGWVDLRAVNWARWRERLAEMARQAESGSDAELGSRHDVVLASPRDPLRPGRMAAWIFRYEDGGERLKR